MARRGRTAVGLLTAIVLTCLAVGPASAASRDAGPGTRVATGTFVVTWFDNAVYAELPDGSTLSRFRATDDVSGDFTGSGGAEAQMLNRADGTTEHTGLILFTGRLDGRSGGFVVRTTGSSDGTSSRSDWTVLPGSGTGELRGIRGHGVETGEQSEGWLAHYRLSYRLG